jgi:hypothetical protein
MAVEAQMVVVPSKLALELIPGLSDEESVEATLQKLKGLIGTGEAKLVGQISLKATSGQQVTGETIEEFRYAVEFDPPDFPKNLQQDPEKAVAVLKAWPIIGYAPTTFETRNVGMTLEIEPVILPNGLVYVRYAMQHVRFRRFQKYDAGVTTAGQHITIDQPIFFTCKTTSASNLRSGEPVLVGTHTLPDEEGIELFLMRVTVQKKPK